MGGSNKTLLSSALNDCGASFLLTKLALKVFCYMETEWPNKGLTRAIIIPYKITKWLPEQNQELVPHYE